MSDSLQPHGLQHARFLCPPLSPRVCSIHIHWVSDAIQPFHPVSLPFPFAFNLSQHQGLFQSQFFTTGGQSIGASASASVLSRNIRFWFLLGLTSLISMLSEGLRVFPSTTIQKHKFFGTQPSLWFNSHIHDYWKNYSFDHMDFCWQSNVSTF